MMVQLTARQAIEVEAMGMIESQDRNPQENQPTTQMDESKIKSVMMGFTGK